jgi:Bacterial SH3 domain
MTMLPVIIALLAGLTAAPGPEQWSVDLSRPVSAGERSTIDGLRSAVYQPHRLHREANAFTAAVDGAGTVDVRGLEPDGDWTEWTETPAVLPTPTQVVQVRVVFGETPPRALSMRASSAAATAPPTRTEAGLTYRIFTTREGLVGGTTASGHVITERDHFAALPSRRGLSTKDSGDYTLKVCAENGRCEWAPVWDVGPWNTRDDYWNPPDVRQMWTDLPQGRPQAQAARQDGYNGGVDQFGRTVRNPAGLDLADGTFWDGLQLTTNAWVTVTYVWTGSGPAGFVRAGEPLNVRNAPNPDAPVVGLAADLAQVRVACRTDGWYRIAPDMWVAAAYVSGVTDAPTC